jgi:PAS domain S-box-containing protein
VLLETTGGPFFGPEEGVFGYYSQHRSVNSFPYKGGLLDPENSLLWDILEQLNDAIYLEVFKNGERREITRANKEAFRRFCSEHETLIGKEFLSDFGLKTMKPSLEEIRKRLNQGQTVRYVISRTGKGLADRWEEIVSIPVKIGEKKAILSVNRDITDIRSIEDELQLTRLQLVAQYQSSPIPTTTWRHVEGDFELVDYNNAVNGITDDRVEEFVGERLSEMYPDRADLLAAMMECYQSHRKLEREIRLRFVTTGISRSLLAVISFLPPNLIIARTQDLSRWKKLESQLRSANEDLNRILDTMGEGLVVLNAMGEMIKLNKKALELFGRPEKEILGHGYSLWTHPDYRDVMASEQHVRRDGKRSSYETRLIRKDGTAFWANIIAVPIIDEYGEFQGSVGCLRDVTQEKEALAELQRLQQFNEQLINYAGVWIAVTDRQAKIVLWNNEAEKISGYPREEVLGDDRVWEWLYPDPEYRSAIKGGQMRMGEDEAYWQGKESVIRCKSGEEKVIQWFIRRCYNDEGELDGWVAAGHDVTESRHNLQRVKDYAAQVQRLSRERTRFLSIASHELFTPLTIINGYVDLLSDSELRPDQREQVKRIQKQLDRLSQLLDDLLSVSRIDSGKTSLVLSQVDLVQVTREAVDPLIPRAISKGISIELSDNDSTVNAYADPRAVVQIVTNIVNNAIAYTPSGGKIKVCVSCCPRAGKIAVLDTGIGIAENDRELVFSEFHRSEKARKLNANGSGLGLSIVKRLVDEMKGKVWVESNGENEGSAFFILLPTVLAKGDGRKDKNAVTDL